MEKIRNPSEANVDKFEARPRGGPRSVAVLIVLDRSRRPGGNGYGRFAD